MVAVIFRFDLKVRSKKVQSKFNFFLKKTYFSDSVSSQESNMCTIYTWPKNVIYFYDVTIFHTYYSHLGVKN